MARINLEDQLWSDQRFLELCILLQDQYAALGAVGMAWKMAQKYWCPDKKPIPKKEFKAHKYFKELIETGLAEEVADGVYIKGSEEHFAWWFEGIAQRIEAGKRSAEVRKQKYGTAIPINAHNNPNETERNRTGARTLPNETEPSSSSSSSNTERKKEQTLIPTDELTEPVLKQVSAELQNKWLLAFRDTDWIQREIKKAILYATSTDKEIKSYSQYLNNWLTRSNEQNPPKPKQEIKKGIVFGTNVQSSLFPDERHKPKRGIQPIEPKGSKNVE